MIGDLRPYITTLYITPLYCTTLHYTTQHSTPLHSTLLHCTALYSYLMGLHDAVDPVRTEGPSDAPTHCRCSPLELTWMHLPVSITLSLLCDCMCLRTSTSILFIAFFLLVLIGLLCHVAVINDNLV